MREGTFEIPPNPKWAPYYGQLRIKYERAARYPWLVVPPDPPEETARIDRISRILSEYRSRRKYDPRPHKDE